MPSAEGQSPSLSGNKSNDPNGEGEVDATVSCDDEKNESTTGNDTEMGQTSNNPAATDVARAGSSGSSALNAFEGTIIGISVRGSLQTAGVAGEIKGDLVVLPVSAFEQVLTPITEKMLTHQLRPLQEKLNDALTKVKSLEKSRDGHQKLWKSVGTGLREGLASVMEQRVTANKAEMNASTTEASSVTATVDLDGQLESSQLIHSILERLNTLKEDIESLKLSDNEYQSLPDLIKQLIERVEALESDRLRANDKDIENCRKQHEDQEENKRRFSDHDEQIKDVYQTQAVQGNHTESLKGDVEDLKKTMDELIPNQSVQAHQPQAPHQVTVQADVTDGDGAEMESGPVRTTVEEGQR